MALADLHIHTVASDGCWTPERVVVEVHARDIDLFAIADHDSVASVPVAEALLLSLPRRGHDPLLPGLV